MSDLTLKGQRSGPPSLARSSNQVGARSLRIRTGDNRQFGEIVAPPVCGCRSPARRGEKGHQDERLLEALTHRGVGVSLGQGLLNACHELGKKVIEPGVGIQLAVKVVEVHKDGHLSSLSCLVRKLRPSVISWMVFACSFPTSGASIEWIQKIEKNPQAKQALDYARTWHTP